MPHFSLSAFGADSPGIVAAVSGALGEQGCNLEDSTGTILRGHFALMLVVTAPEGTTTGSLERALSDVAERFDLVISIRQLTHEAVGLATPDDAEPLTVSVHGADRPGIVRAISQALADDGGNVVELSTQLVEGGDAAVYVMTLRVLAQGGTGDTVADEVRRTAEGLGVQCTVRRDDADVL